MSQQTTIEAIAVMIEEAKNLLKSAKELANSHGIYYDFEHALRELYEDVSEEYVDWNSSSC